MVEKLFLEAEVREETGKQAAKKMRNSGMVPAVFYGKNIDSLKIAVNASELSSVLRKSEAKMNSIFNLKIKDKDKVIEEMALIQDCDKDPIKDTFVHLDFMRINVKEAITTRVLVKLVGESPAVKAGLLLTQQVHDLIIKCLPMEIPSHIDIDVSGIEGAHDAVRVGDLKLNNMKIEMPADQIIVHAEVPRSMKVEEAPAAPVSAEVPVIGEKKESEAAPAEDNKDKKKKE